MILEDYFQLIRDFDHHPYAIDISHNFLLMGLLLAHKPQDILELGIGTGFVTKTIFAAIDYNQRGNLTCVDNWLDTGFKEPEMVNELRKRGAKIICQTEEKFMTFCPTNSFDFLISDADHQNSHKWLCEHLRVVKNDGILLFHDTNGSNSGLCEIPERVKHLPSFHFTENTRSDERCDRGWLLVFNKKF